MKKIEFKPMLISIILVLLIYYFYTPALNIHAIEFWIFIIIALCIYGAASSYNSLVDREFNPKKVGSLGVIVAVIMGGVSSYLIYSQVRSSMLHVMQVV